MRWSFFASLLVTVLAIGCDRNTSATVDGITTVEVWHPWGQDQLDNVKTLCREFEKAHPKIRIKLVYSANNLTSSQKLFMAIAGGQAPDVTFVDGQQLIEWAARGAVADLSESVKAAGISPDDFWTPRWEESTFRGRVYALPWGVDPNFAMAWNKQMFRDAGLDPEKPPRTIAELDEYNRKLTREVNGNMVSIGLVPWQWGNDNSVFTWVYAFGGELYQPGPTPDSVGKVTADNPRAVEAMRWMQKAGQEMGVRKVAGFNSAFVGAANNPFYLGKQAISLVHASQMQSQRRFAPTLDYGIGYIPAPPGGEYPSGWLGGWSLAVPRGKTVTPEAFEFIRWACVSPEGNYVTADLMEQFPAYRKAAYYERVQTDPALAERRVFYEILKNCKHARTLIPVQGYVMELLRRSTDEILYGGRDAKAAMEDVSRLAQIRLEAVVKAVDAR